MKGREGRRQLTPGWSASARAKRPRRRISHGTVSGARSARIAPGRPMPDPAFRPAAIARRIWLRQSAADCAGPSASGRPGCSLRKGRVSWPSRAGASPAPGRCAGPWPDGRHPGVPGRPRRPARAVRLPPGGRSGSPPVGGMAWPARIRVSLTMPSAASEWSVGSKSAPRRSDRTAGRAMQGVMRDPSDLTGQAEVAELRREANDLAPRGCRAPAIAVMTPERWNGQCGIELSRTGDGRGDRAACTMPSCPRPAVRPGPPEARAAPCLRTRWLRSRSSGRCSRLEAGRQPGMGRHGAGFLAISRMQRLSR